MHASRVLKKWRLTDICVACETNYSAMFALTSPVVDYRASVFRTLCGNGISRSIIRSYGIGYVSAVHLRWMFPHAWTYERGSMILLLMSSAMTSTLLRAQKTTATLCYSLFQVSKNMSAWLPHWALSFGDKFYLLLCVEHPEFWHFFKLSLSWNCSSKEPESKWSG